eukprot:gene30590-biopygen16437
MILNAVGLDMVSETKRVQAKGKRTKEEINYRLCPESVCQQTRMPPDGLEEKDFALDAVYPMKALKEKDAALKALK